MIGAEGAICPELAGVLLEDIAQGEQTLAEVVGLRGRCRAVDEMQAFEEGRLKEENSLDVFVQRVERVLGRGE